MTSRIILALTALLMISVFVSCDNSSVIESNTKPMGDLSNNGTAFDIADLVIFLNYLVGGDASLPDGTIPGLSDINRDGQPFTVADYVCFKMIFDGNAKYRQKFPADPVEVQFEVGELLYIFQPVAAIRLVLEGNADVALVPEFASMWYEQRDGKTYVLVTPRWEDAGGELSGQVLYLDHANILQIEMALPDGSPAIPKQNVPQRFFLEDNYPNPFQDNTAIRFELSIRTEWRLEILNYLGILVDEFSGFSEAGIVEIVWDPGDLPYGVYFYRLTAGEESYTKSMSYIGPDY